MTDAELVGRLKERAQQRETLAIFSEPRLRKEDTVEWEAAARIKALSARGGEVPEEPQEYGLGTNLERECFMVARPRGGYIKRADYDALRKEYDALRAASGGAGWVSVKERVPEADGEVLTYFQDQVGILIWRNRWHWASGMVMQNADAIEVTHWQPLPPAPTEGGDK